MCISFGRCAVSPVWIGQYRDFVNFFFFFFWFRLFPTMSECCCRLFRSFSSSSFSKRSRTHAADDLRLCVSLLLLFFSPSSHPCPSASSSFILSANPSVGDCFLTTHPFTRSASSTSLILTDRLQQASSRSPSTLSIFVATFLPLLLHLAQKQSANTSRLNP